jgi:DNA-binding response OmpR family regulator
MIVRDILIVEDEIKISEILKDYLIQAGYRVNCLDRENTVVSGVRKNPPGLWLFPCIDRQHIFSI